MEATLVAAKKEKQWIAEAQRRAEKKAEKKRKREELKAASS